jgi:hypothetical protein
MGSTCQSLIVAIAFAFRLDNDVAVAAMLLPPVVANAEVFTMSLLSRRDFLRTSAAGLAAGGLLLRDLPVLAQQPGERPKQLTETQGAESTQSRADELYHR